jgi:hypothetical protein
VSICVWAQGDSLRSFSASFLGNSIQLVLRFCAITAAAEISVSNTAKAVRDFTEGLCIGSDRVELPFFTLRRNTLLPASQNSSLPSYIISETLKRRLIFSALPTSVAKRTSPLLASMNGLPSSIRGKTNLAPRLS